MTGRNNRPNSQLDYEYKRAVSNTDRFYSPAIVCIAKNNTTQQQRKINKRQQLA